MRYEAGYNMKDDRFEIHRSGCSKAPEGCHRIEGANVHEAIASEVASFVEQGQEFTADDFYVHPCARN